MQLTTKLTIVAFATALCATVAAHHGRADAGQTLAQQCVPHSNACKLYIAQLQALDDTKPPSASGTSAQAPLAVKCAESLRDGSHEVAMLYDIEWATLVYEGMSVAKAQAQAAKDHLGGRIADSNLQKCNSLKLYKLGGSGLGEPG